MGIGLLAYDLDALPARSGGVSYMESMPPLGSPGARAAFWHRRPKGLQNLFGEGGAVARERARVQAVGTELPTYLVD